MLPYFLEEGSDNELIFKLDDKELIFFIPAIFFDRKYAENSKGYLKIFGIFNYVIRDIKTGKDTPLYLFDFPAMFETTPSLKDTVRGFEYEGLPKDDYVLLRYQKGDVVVNSTEVIQDISNAELFFKMFISGRIPSSIPYDTLQNYFVDSMAISGKSYDLNMQLFGIIIGEMAASAKDEKVLFRHTDMSDMNAYKIKNITMSPKYVSPFSSYTSENYNEAIVNASLVSNKSSTSPMEKLFMGYKF